MTPIAPVSLKNIETQWTQKSYMQVLFYSLEVVGRGSETQLRVDKKFNCIM